jgi:hypothetical protein
MRSDSPGRAATSKEQTIGVIRRLDTLFNSGRWERGQHYDDGGYCLLGAVYSSTQWTLPEVRGEVLRELCASLPRSGRLLAKIVGRRAALAVYNDIVGREKGARRLAKTTLARVDAGWPYDVRSIVAGTQVEAPGPGGPVLWTARKQREAA